MNLFSPAGDSFKGVRYETAGEEEAGAVVCMCDGCEQNTYMCPFVLIDLHCNAISIDLNLQNLTCTE